MCLWLLHVQNLHCGQFRYDCIECNEVISQDALLLQQTASHNGCHRSMLLEWGYSRIWAIYFAREQSFSAVEGLTEYRRKKTQQHKTKLNGTEHNVKGNNTSWAYSFALTNGLVRTHSLLKRPVFCVLSTVHTWLHIHTILESENTTFFFQHLPVHFTDAKQSHH